jgi:hypothetical protein
MAMRRWSSGKDEPRVASKYQRGDLVVDDEKAAHNAITRPSKL